MDVIRYTAVDGRQFFTSDCKQEAIADTVRRMGDCHQVDLIEMTEQEYNAIPATNESAALWVKS